MRPREVARALDARGSPHEVARLRKGSQPGQKREVHARGTTTHRFDVAVLRELARDERAERGVLLPREERGARREPEAQVRAARLPERALARLVVQDVVYELRGARGVGD